MIATSRKQAKHFNLPRFNTGRPCSKQHLSDRYTSNGACVQCSNDQAYAYRSERPDWFSSYKVKWYKENRQAKILQSRQWQKDNPKTHAAYKAKRRADKLSATPPWADLERIKRFYQNCPEGYHVDHIIPLQHPLICGLHVSENLQYLTAEENMKKGNRFIPELASFPHQPK